MIAAPGSPQRRQHEIARGRRPPSRGRDRGATCGRSARAGPRWRRARVLARRRATGRTDPRRRGLAARARPGTPPPPAVTATGTATAPEGSTSRVMPATGTAEGRAPGSSTAAPPGRAAPAIWPVLPRRASRGREIRVAVTGTGDPTPYGTGATQPPTASSATSSTFQPRSSLLESVCRSKRTVAVDAASVVSSATLRRSARGSPTRRCSRCVCQARRAGRRWRHRQHELTPPRSWIRFGAMRRDESWHVGARKARPNPGNQP